MIKQNKMAYRGIKNFKKKIIAEKISKSDPPDI